MYTILNKCRDITALVSAFQIIEVVMGIRVDMSAR